MPGNVARAHCIVTSISRELAANVMILLGESGILKPAGPVVVGPTITSS